jgi:hypothetical protein
MKLKDIYRIINEEIVQFDFLSNESLIKETESVELLSQRNFQRSFIIDSITNMREKINLNNTPEAHITEPDYDENQDNIDFEYYIEIIYQYQIPQNNNNNPIPQNEDNPITPIPFNIDFSGKPLKIYMDGYSDPGDGYTQPPEGDTWMNSVNWSDIEVKLFTPDGQEIPFAELGQASEKTRELFIRAYCESILESNVNMEVKDRKPQYSTFNQQ